MKKYINNILEIYSIKNLLIEGLLICFVIIAVDIFNLCTFLVNNNCTFLIFLIIILILLKVLRKEHFKMLMARNINKFDKIPIITSEIIIICSIYTFFIDYQLYKQHLLFILFLINIICWYIRIFYVSTTTKEQKYNVYDLKRICSEQIELNENETLLLEECDVNYDLLNRTQIINHLFNTIIKCYPEKNFTIGLNGKWGDGKTTIINNVLRLLDKNKLTNEFLIIKFDPWKYDNEKAILKGFLNQILDEINFDFRFGNNDILISEIINSIFEKKESVIFKLIHNELNNTKNSYKIEKIVNNYLKNNQKRLLLIIDNLDRINGDKALFLIKCLETITKFNNSIYILSYDEEILNEAFKTIFHSSRNYMDKIVQLKIDIPIIDTNTINNLKEKAANNIIVDGEPIINFINNNQYVFNNVRSLKRFLNSITSLNLSFLRYLDKNDEANITYIKSECPDLYYEIYNNKKFFVSFDRQYDPNVYTFDQEQLNTEIKQYFDKLLSLPKYKKYHSILGDMFPNVRNHLHRYTPPPQNEYQNSIRNNKICNTRYFDLYFTDADNDFIRLNNDTKNIIERINNYNDFDKHLEAMLETYNIDEIKVFSELLQVNLEAINQKKYKDLIIFLMNFHHFFKKRISFFGLDSSNRINSIIADLLIHISKNDFEEIKNNLKNNFKILSNLRNILYWVENNEQHNVSYNFDFKQFYNEQCKKVLEENIDIYSDKNYHKDNIWALYTYNNQKTQDYLLKNINQKNIYKFINDLISTSVGTKYGYHIKKENFELLAPNIDIDNLLKKHKKKLNDKESFIKEVYDEYKNPKDKMSDGLYIDTYIDL